MKNAFLFIQLLIPAVLFGQYKNFGSELFFVRQPSARAEAMGRSYCAIDGDLTSVYFNPAGIATLKGIELDGSYTTPHYSLDKANYKFLSLGYKFNKYIVAGLTVNHFSYGQEIAFTDDFGNPNYTFIPYTSNYSLTLASQPIKNLLIGLNTNLFVWNPVKKNFIALNFDFGVIKKFELVNGKNYQHSASLGTSIKNFNYSKVKIDYAGSKSEESLPVIMKYGANYQITFDKHLLIDSLKTLRLLVQGEFQDLLNSDYYTTSRIGGEIMFLEILSMRAGYFKEKVDNYGYPDRNKSEVSAFTYGFGLQIPLHKLTKLPLNINLDYTNLPQTSYSKISTQWDNFQVYNVRLNWMIGGRNNPK